MFVGLIVILPINYSGDTTDPHVTEMAASPSPTFARTIPR